VDPATVLANFEATLRNQVALVLETATGSPAGGGPRWDEVLGSMGVTGVPAAERGAVASQRQHNRGAFPEEVEAVFLALAHQAWDTLQQIHGWGLAQQRPDLQGKLDALAQQIRTLSADQRQAYEEGLRPKPVVGAGVAAIFANARATAQINPWGHLKYSDQLTLACPGCGAPQQAQLVFDCRFCGNSLFGPPGQT
jgi:hypothetical protein